MAGSVMKIGIGTMPAPPASFFFSSFFLFFSSSLLSFVESLSASSDVLEESVSWAESVEAGTTNTSPNAMMAAVEIRSALCPPRSTFLTIDAPPPCDLS
jgi:hypothetical protein